MRGALTSVCLLENEDGTFVVHYKVQTKQHSFFASIQLRRFHFQFSIILCGHDKQANLTERIIEIAKCPFHDKQERKKN